MMRQRKATRKSHGPFSLERLEERLYLATSYTFVDLPPLPECRWAAANAVNDSGWVAGVGCNSTSHVTPVLWRVDSAGTVVRTALPVSTQIGGSADDVNNLGQIAGTNNVNDGGLNPPHAVVWQADTTGAFVAHDLGTLGGNFTQSWAHGISDSNGSGQVLVVGQSDASTASVILRHAVAWQVDTAGNVLKTIDLEPLAADSNAYGVNKSGQIVGTSNASGLSHAVVWQVDTLGNVVSRTDLGTLPSGSSSGANDVNSLGHVVGGAATGKINRCGRENSDAVLWKNGTITDLGSLGDAGSYAAGTNDSDVVVGNFFKTKRDPFAGGCRDFIPSAFVWQNGVMTDLKTFLPKNSKWTLQSANEVNGAGQIAGGMYVTVSGGNEGHAYLATPKTSALTAASASSEQGTDTLNSAEAQMLVPEALARWRGAGLDTSSLSTIDVRIANLPGATLGEAVGNTIWLDSNAAGWGWFVDATPWDDSEFTTPGNQGEQGHMDLLTAVAHELGHLLGYDHSDDGTMHDTLATGERLMPTPIVGSVGDRPQRVEPAVFDLIFIEEKDKKNTWSSDRLAHDLLSDLDLAQVR